MNFHFQLPTSNARKKNQFGIFITIFGSMKKQKTKNCRRKHQTLFCYYHDSDKKLRTNLGFEFARSFFYEL